MYLFKCDDGLVVVEPPGPEVGGDGLTLPDVYRGLHGPRGALPSPVVRPVPPLLIVPLSPVTWAQQEQGAGQK